MSKIEVRKNGAIMQVFNDESGLPDNKTIQSMKEAGYRLYQDGKLYKPTKKGGDTPDKKQNK